MRFDPARWSSVIKIGLAIGMCAFFLFELYMYKGPTDIPYSRESLLRFGRLALLLITTVLVLGLWITVVRTIRSTREQNSRREDFKLIVGTLIRILAIIGGPVSVVFIFSFYGDRILPFLGRILGLYGTRVVIFCVVVGFGISAHVWKRKNQYTYGFGEVLFACMATGYIAFRIVPGQSVLSQWIALMGAAYVIARGLNNISDAKGKGFKSLLKVLRSS